MLVSSLCCLDACVKLLGEKIGGQSNRCVAGELLRESKKGKDSCLHFCFAVQSSTPLFRELHGKEKELHTGGNTL